MTIEGIDDIFEGLDEGMMPSRRPDDSPYPHEKIRFDEYMEKEIGVLLKNIDHLREKERLCIYRTFTLATCGKSPYYSAISALPGHLRVYFHALMHLYNEKRR